MSLQIILRITESFQPTFFFEVFILNRAYLSGSHCLIAYEVTMDTFTPRMSRKICLHHEELDKTKLNKNRDRPPVRILSRSFVMALSRNKAYIVTVKIISLEFGATYRGERKKLNNLQWNL